MARGLIVPAFTIHLAVGVGSGIGAAARHVASLAALATFGPAFPWGTLTVNVAGSFVIGLYATLTGPGGRLHAAPALRQFVLAGFCGGFTTFSIFSLETLRLARDGRVALAGAYVLLSALLWLVAVWLGYLLGRHLNRLKGA